MRGKSKFFPSAAVLEGNALDVGDHGVARRKNPIGKKPDMGDFIDKHGDELAKGALSALVATALAFAIFLPASISLANSAETAEKPVEPMKAESEGAAPVTVPSPVELPDAGDVGVADLPDAGGGEPIADAFESVPAESVDGRTVYRFDVASREHLSQAAIDAGGIVENDYGYYVAHSYDAGGAFLGFEVGDVVCIDGREIVLEGCTYANYDEVAVYDLRERIGYDKVCFQTCTGIGTGIVIWYGSAPSGEVFASDSADIWSAYDAETASLLAEQELLDAEGYAAADEMNAAVDSGDDAWIASASERWESLQTWAADFHVRCETHNASAPE